MLNITIYLFLSSIRLKNQILSQLKGTNKFDNYKARTLLVNI